LRHHVLEVAGGHALGVESHDLVVEAGRATLVLGDAFRRDGGIAVARGVAGDLAAVALDGLRRGAVAAVGNRFGGCRSSFGDGHGWGLQVFQLGVEQAFEGGRHELSEQSVEVIDGASLGRDLLGRLFSSGFDGRIHA
jgi:hypothetical protein